MTADAARLRPRAAARPAGFLPAVVLFAAVLPASVVSAEEPLERASRKGPVEATVRLEPARPRIGDVVTLTIRVAADKGVELLMPQFGEALERFAILDYSTGEQIDDAGRTVVTQVYELQPPRSGPQSIPPIMVEFVDRRDGAKAAPDGLDAYELLTERLAFEVESVVPKDAEADLNPPMLDALPPLEPPAGARWPWVVVGLVLIPAVACAWRFWAAWRRRARRRSAYDIAIARLRGLTAGPRSEAEQIDAFFVELSSIVRWYLETRFELRAPELTTEEFLATMSASADLSSAHQPLLRDFLRRADLVKFAHFVPSDQDIDQSVSVARRFLEETGADAPLLDQAHEPPPTAPAAARGAEKGDAVRV